MLNEWAHHIGAALTAKDSSKLAECFPVNVEDSNIAVLQNFLWQTDPNTTISNFNPDWDWPAMTAFARQYLWQCYYLNPRDIESLQPALQRTFSALQTAFSQANGFVLTDLVVQFVSILQYRIWVATPLLRIFNNIRSEREPVTAKSDILLFISTRLCRIYYTTNQISLCNTVFRSLENKRLESYPISQQVELKYAEGRYALIKGDVETAFKHLQWSYNHCCAGPNKARVFEQLLLPAILSGRMPKGQTLQAVGRKNPELQRSMTLLCIAIRQVKFGALEEALETPWIKKHRFSSLVRSHAPILVLRRAIKLLYKVRNQPRALELLDIRNALVAAGYFTEDNNLAETESACIALMEPKMIYANMQTGDDPSGTRLLLRPKDPIPRRVSTK